MPDLTFQVAGVQAVPFAAAPLPGFRSQTMRTMLRTHAGALAPALTRAADFELQVPCPFDFNVAAVKYFRGTVFYQSGGNLQVAPISWSKGAWLCLRRDVVARLSQHKMRQGVPTREKTLEALLERSGEKVAQ